ncbi:MAG: hypothetical protein OEY22_04725 [Candidatus Bathyarchaeota archaeon]|nr:hypothetical protein [Candidatus Bathyarchaeota archaeon]MDH5787094.1 hypothetical protein [Candidatus Bathyarchaeota archaeon]
MSSTPDEIVVLLLKNVVYRHSELRSLEEFLVEKYGFSKIEEKEYAISELRKIVQIEREGTVLGEEGSEKKLSSLKIYEGSHLDTKIRVCIMGEVVQKEDVIVGTGEEERYPVYTAEYQMIKLVSESGYAMQQLIERIAVDLGLEIRSREWVFHRSKEG